jgi:glycosyl transferase family 1
LVADDDVIRAGYVGDDDLPALYSAAAVFVFPSWLEGFGLPPLEAMTCGTPVIGACRAVQLAAYGAADARRVPARVCRRSMTPGLHAAPPLSGCRLSVSSDML